MSTNSSTCICFEEERDYEGMLIDGGRITNAVLCKQGAQDSANPFMANYHLVRNGSSILHLCFYPGLCEVAVMGSDFDAPFEFTLTSTYCNILE